MRSHTIVALAIVAAITPSIAGTISKSEARRRVADIEKSDTAFLEKYPAFKDVIAVVKTDCVAKVPELASSTTFCDCGAALTLELWRSGADPKLMQRLTDYAAHPDPTHAGDFLKYEGPELYRPLCELAE